MKTVTNIVYCIKNKKVLLGLKKRGQGFGQYNGYGGKVDIIDKSIEKSALRELKEESGLIAKEKDLVKVAEIKFYFPDLPKEKSWNQTVCVYVLEIWKGTPKETEEMKPKWFSFDALPKDKMWVDNQYWVPRVLNGEKLKGKVYFKGKADSVLKYQFTAVNKF